MLLRLYSEYAAQPEPTLEIVARATAPVLPRRRVFVTVPLSDAELWEEISRPAARVESLPHQATSFAESSIAPLAMATSSSRRATTPHRYPRPTWSCQRMKLPRLRRTQLLSQRPNVLRRSAAPIRSATCRCGSRRGPSTAARPQRPNGLAELPAVRGEEQQPAPADAFAHRRSSVRTPPENQTAIDRGLEFLARMQLDDGRWQFRNLRGEVDANAEPASPRRRRRHRVGALGVSRRGARPFR